jgi:DNA-binding ferritin-like protein
MADRIKTLRRSPAARGWLALFLKCDRRRVFGPDFHDLQLRFEDHAGQILATIDGVTERGRILGGDPLRGPWP